MRLACGPGWYETAETGSDRQLRAPVIGDVLAVIELDRDAEIIVGDEIVLANLGRELVHAPRPAKPRVRLERQDRVLDQESGVIVGMAADGLVMPVGAAGAVGLGRADEPEIVPTLWRQHRIQQPVYLEREQVVDIAKRREPLKPVERLPLPAQDQHVEIAGDPA